MKMFLLKLLLRALLFSLAAPVWAVCVILSVRSH
jgi:hypothetical protein